MTEREHHGSEDQAHTDPAAEHGTVGKAPLVASAASTGGKGKSVKDVLQNVETALKEENKKLAKKLLSTAVSKFTDEVSKKLNKAEEAADSEIDENLDPNNPKCLNEGAINAVERAINTKRLFATLRMCQAVEKAIKSEIDSLKSDDSAVKKGIKLFENASAVIDAVNKFADAMTKANGQIQRLHQQAANCRPKVAIDEFLKTYKPPLQPGKVPELLPIAPDKNDRKSSPPPGIHLHISPTGQIQIGI